MKFTVPVAFFLLASAAAAQAESFLCVGQLSTGYRWTGERWAIDRIETEDKVFVVQPSAGAADYAVTQIGAQAPSHYCPPVRRPDGTLRLYCGGGASSFSFSSKTLRFQEFYGLGYTDGGDSNANVPHISIGKCVELELRGILEDGAPSPGEAE